MKRNLILSAGLCLSLGTGMVASEKVQRKINFSGSWVLTKSKTDQSASSSGLGGRSMGGRRTGGGSGGGGRYPGGGYPGGGRRGSGRGEDPSEGKINDSAIFIEQSDSELKVTHKVNDAAGKERDFQQIFKLDGSESVNRALSHGGGELKSRTSWQKEKLVTLGSQEPAGSNNAARASVVVKQELTLSKDSKMLTVKTRRSSARGQVTTTEIFTRQAVEKK